jgi:hypothetical protein
MDVALTGPRIDPVVDAEMAELADEALSRAGCDDLGEFLREGSDEANELLEKLNNSAGPTPLRSSCTESSRVRPCGGTDHVE